MSARRGFTLLETLMVVMILAILASVIVPAVRGRDERTLEATARNLAMDLRYARSLAIQYNTHYTVRFDFSQNAYEIAHTGTGTPPLLRSPLAPETTAARTLRVALNPSVSGGSGQANFRWAGAYLKESGTRVEDVTFGPKGGSGPDRNEDTILWIAQGIGSDTQFLQITVSWVTGLVWLSAPADEMNVGTTSVAVSTQTL